MTERDEMRALAAAHGCDYEYIPVSEKSGIYKRVYTPVRPVPCVRDENGEIKKQTVKQLFAKLDEEVNEFKAAVLREVTVRNDLSDIADGVDDDTDMDIVLEGADVKTVITSIENALGYGVDRRDEAQRCVNRRNLERGRL